MAIQLLKGAAGSGKTELVLRQIAESERMPFEIYVPTHKLADECEARLRRLNPLKKISVMHGRDYCQVGTSPLCRKYKVADVMAKAGLSILPSLCSKTSSRGLPPVRCEHYHYCEYIQQFSQTSDVYIYPHAYLPLQRSALDKRTPAGVVIDESFVMNLIEKVTFPISLLNHSAVPVAARQLCGELAIAIGSDAVSIRGVVTKNCDEGSYISAMHALQHSTSEINPEMSEAQIKASIKRIVMFKPLMLLLEHLMRSRHCQHPPQSIIFDHTTGVVTIHHRKQISRFTRQSQYEAEAPMPPLLMIDASASRLITEKIFPDLKYDEIPLERDAHVIQCKSTRCSTTSIVPDKNSDKKSKAAARRKIVDIQALINRLADEGKSALIVGPSAVVGNASSGKKSLLKCPDGVEFAHFNALRGMDKWKQCDTVVVIGRNQPSVEAVEDIARAIFFSDRTPLQLTGRWEEEVRGYRCKDGEYGVAVQTHADPRVQAVLEQIREHETLQAIDRIRLIHNTEPKQVILLSNLPLDITVDELLSWDDVIYGSRIEQAWKSLNGVLPLNSAWLSEKFGELWETEEAAKKDVSRACKRGQTPNNSYIRKMAPLAYEYKLPHQRSWSRCLSRFPDQVAVLAELQILVGQVVVVRPKSSVTF